MATPTTTTPTQVGGVNVGLVAFYGIAAVALLALAAPLPNVATAFLVILITGTVLINYKDYVGLFTPPPAN